jgi:hypothetical protein
VLSSACSSLCGADPGGPAGQQLPSVLRCEWCVAAACSGGGSRVSDFGPGSCPGTNYSVMSGL